jgi:hypothetical protein
VEEEATIAQVWSEFQEAGSEDARRGDFDAIAAPAKGAAWLAGKSRG